MEALDAAGAGLRLPAGTRNAFVLAGCVAVGGAVGGELIGEPMTADTMIYKLTTAVEDGMEMYGVIIFLAALMRYMTRAQSGHDDLGVTVSLRG